MHDFRAFEILKTSTNKLIKIISYVISAHAATKDASILLEYFFVILGKQK